MTDWHNNQGSEAGLVETLTVQFCIVCDSVVVSEDLRVVVNIDNNLFSHGYERGCKHNLIKLWTLFRVNIVIGRNGIIATMKIYLTL